MATAKSILFQTSTDQLDALLLELCEDSGPRIVGYWHIPSYGVVNKNKMSYIISKTTIYSVFCK
jgi:hypothetical protein